MMRKKLGFTLIEFLITASIIGILVTAGIAGFVSFNKREKLKSAALSVKTYLREAQTSALAGKKDCSISACGGTTDGCSNDIDGSEKPLDGWYVDLLGKRLYGRCGGTDFSLKIFQIPSKVTLSFYAPDGTPDAQRAVLKFKPLGQGVDKDLIICLSGFGRKYKLAVTTAGRINDLGFVSTCP